MGTATGLGGIALFIIILVVGILILRLLGAWMLRINDVIKSLGKIHDSNGKLHRELWEIKVLTNELVNHHTGLKKPLRAGSMRY